MTEQIWNLVLGGVPLIAWVVIYLLGLWYGREMGYSKIKTHAQAILNSTIIAFVVFMLLAGAGLLYKATEAFRYEVAPKFQEWVPVKVVELEAISTTTGLSGGGGLLFISIGENDVVSYLAKSDDGGVTLERLNVNNRTKFYEIPADATESESIPRIVWLKCKVTDPNSPKDALCDAGNLGQRVEVWVPEGSISRDMSVSPR